MKKYLILLIILILAATPVMTSAHEDCNFVGLLDAWAGATVPGMPNGAVYGYLVNLTDEHDTLLSATTDVADVVEVHETTVDEDDVMRMQPLVDGLMVAPRNYVQMQRGGYHFMLFNLQQTLEADTTFDLTLVFENAGEVVVTVPVYDMAAMDMDSDEEATDDMSMNMDDMSMDVDEECAGVYLLGAWARPGVAMPNSAAYGLLVNMGAEDVSLVSVTGSVAAAIELHEMSMDGDVMRMSPIEGGIVIPAGGVAQLQPGGLHIMMIGLAQDLVVDTSIALTLTFDDETVIEIEVPVQEPPETPPIMQHD